MRLLAGEVDRAAALALFQAATRRYAKRQTTWFRHQFPAGHTIRAQFSERLMPKIFQFIRESG
jgi:tRNA dimethylallyltransferase